MKPRSIALISGGLDSSVALALAIQAHDVVRALTFDYGQRAVVQERRASSDLCRTYGIVHEVIALPWIAQLTRTALVDKKWAVPEVGEDVLDDVREGRNRARDVWVPNRNGLFANIAACYADSYDAHAIIVGFNAEEGATFTDNTRAFAHALDGSFEFSTLVRPNMISPTLDLSKKDIARHAVELGITSFWSCYHGGPRMCGRCESCVRTLRAFRAIDHLDAIAHHFEEGTI